MTQPQQEEALDLKPLDEILQAYRGVRGAVIPVLQKAQAVYGYLPSEVIQRVAQGMRVPVSQVYGVATFYSQYYLKRRGRHIVRQCDGTACHVRGSAKILAKMEQELGIPMGETTPDYEFTTEVVYCLGSCGLAPVAVVDDRVVGNLVPEKMVALLRNLRAP